MRGVCAVIGCREAVALMDRYAEIVTRGDDPAVLLPLAKHHPEMCKGCREEFIALLKILESEKRWQQGAGQRTRIPLKSPLPRVVCEEPRMSPAQESPGTLLRDEAQLQEGADSAPLQAGARPGERVETKER
jgi:hypothetical protein